jgi:hypothetical protein
VYPFTPEQIYGGEAIPEQQYPPGTAPPSSAVQPAIGSPGWVPQSKAELQQYAQMKGWSEDYDRFPDAQVMQWVQENWDANQGAFRTEKRDAQCNPIEGFVEKPVDTPDGWTAWGNYAIPTAEAEQRAAGFGTKPGAAGAAASNTDVQEVGARGLGTEQNASMYGVLSDRNFQQLRGAYGLGSDPALNQTGDLMTLKNGAMMWGGAGDGAQPFIPNLGGQYGNVKQVQAATDPAQQAAQLTSGFKVFGGAPVGMKPEGTPFGAYTPQANADFSMAPQFNAPANGVSPDFASMFGGGSWAKRTPKPKQGAFGALPADDGGGW